MTHPSGCRPDEIAGQGSVHRHRMGHAPLNIRAPASVPSNSDFGRLPGSQPEGRGPGSPGTQNAYMPFVTFGCVDKPTSGGDAVSDVGGFLGVDDSYDFQVDPLRQHFKESVPTAEEHRDLVAGPAVEAGAAAGTG